MEKMHYIKPIDQAIDKTEAKIISLKDKNMTKDEILKEVKKDKKPKSATKKAEVDFKQLEEKIDKEIDQETTKTYEADGVEYPVEHVGKDTSVKTEIQTKIDNEVKEIQFEGHKLRAEISQLENGDESLRLTSENGEEMPGGVHGENDPMEELINKYIGEDEQEEEYEVDEQDSLKAKIAEQELILKKE